MRKLIIRHWFDTLDVVGTAVEQCISHISLGIQRLEQKTPTETSSFMRDLTPIRTRSSYTNLETLKTQYGQELREIAAKAGRVCIGDKIYDNPAILQTSNDTEISSHHSKRSYSVRSPLGNRGRASD